MDVSAPARPISHQRPTQAYYVPRRILENGRGPQPTTNTKSESEKESREPVVKPAAPVPASKSPSKETTNSSNRGNKNSNNNNNTNNNNNNCKNQSNNVARKSSSPRELQQNSQPNSENRRKSKPVTGKESHNNTDTTKENRQKTRNSPVSATASLITSPKTQTTITSKPPVTRPNPFCSQALEGGKEQCICKRPDGHIICKRCGFEGRGRVQVVCLQHPMKLNLMDLRECPESYCRSIQLVEMPC